MSPVLLHKLQNLPRWHSVPQRESSLRRRISIVLTTALALSGFWGSDDPTTNTKNVTRSVSGIRLLYQRPSSWCLLCPKLQAVKLVLLLAGPRWIEVFMQWSTWIQAWLVLCWFFSLVTLPPQSIASLEQKWFWLARIRWKVLLSLVEGKNCSCGNFPPWTGNCEEPWLIFFSTFWRQNTSTHSTVIEVQICTTGFIHSENSASYTIRCNCRCKVWHVKL